MYYDDLLLHLLKKKHQNGSSNLAGLSLAGFENIQKFYQEGAEPKPYYKQDGLFYV
jgi:hypothetical protein